MMSAPKKWSKIHIPKYQKYMRELQIKGGALHSYKLVYKP